VHRARGATCNAAVTVRRTDGRFRFTGDPGSGGGCICLKLRQRSCRFAHRRIDGTVENSQRIGDLIDMLKRIRAGLSKSRERETKALEGIV
jgi:hypothetical protein